MKTQTAFICAILPHGRARENPGDPGLFGAEDAVDLEKTLGELKTHEGNVWTIIYSLRREDAARLAIPAKEFRAIKNAIIQEAERLRLQLEESSAQASANPTLASENTSSVDSHHMQLPPEYLLNSTIRLFHQMGQIFRDNAMPPCNPMGIRMDSKRRKKLLKKRRGGGDGGGTTARSRGVIKKFGNP